MSYYWVDCDYGSSYCSSCGYPDAAWVSGGETFPFGEYEPLSKPECCGDDQGEYLINQGVGPTRCCNSRSDCVDSNGICRNEYPTEISCSDDIDNDCDGKTDCWDVDCSCDPAAPSKVNDLSVSNFARNSLTLSWTAPGDDQDVGIASEYDIRYYSSVITEDNWDLATQCEGEQTPKIAGSSEIFNVSNLSEDTTYYFALKAVDNNSNWSLISNSCSGKTYPTATGSLDITIDESYGVDNVANSIDADIDTFTSPTEEADDWHIIYSIKSDINSVAVRVRQGDYYKREFHISIWDDGWKEIYESEMNSREVLTMFEGFSPATNKIMLSGTGDVFIHEIMVNNINKKSLTRFNGSNYSKSRFYGSGDANNDGWVDEEDLVLCIALAEGVYDGIMPVTDFRRETNAWVDAVDVNGDGDITQIDINLIRKYMFGEIEHLPSHWQKLGRDERKSWISKMNQKHPDMSLCAPTCCYCYAHEIAPIYDYRAANANCGGEGAWRGRFGIATATSGCAVPGGTHWHATWYVGDWQIKKERVVTTYYLGEEVSFPDEYEGRNFYGYYLHKSKNVSGGIDAMDVCKNGYTFKTIEGEYESPSDYNEESNWLTWGETGTRYGWQLLADPRPSETDCRYRWIMSRHHDDWDKWKHEYFGCRTNEPEYQWWDEWPPAEEDQCLQPYPNTFLDLFFNYPYYTPKPAE